MASIQSNTPKDYPVAATWMRALGFASGDAKLLLCTLEKYKGLKPPPRPRGRPRGPKDRPLAIALWWSIGMKVCEANEIRPRTQAEVFREYFQREIEISQGKTVPISNHRLGKFCTACARRLRESVEAALARTDANPELSRVLGDDVQRWREYLRRRT